MPPRPEPLLPPVPVSFSGRRRRSNAAPPAAFQHPSEQRAAGQSIQAPRENRNTRSLANPSQLVHASSSARGPSSNLHLPLTAIQDSRVNRRSSQWEQRSGDLSIFHGVGASDNRLDRAGSNNHTSSLSNSIQRMVDSNIDGPAPLGLTIDVAAQRLRSNLTSSTGRSQAQQGLRTALEIAMQASQTEPFYTPHAAFSILDRALFRGDLSGAVFLRWDDTSPTDSHEEDADVKHTSGRTYPPRRQCPDNPYSKRTAIVLHSEFAARFVSRHSPDGKGFDGKAIAATVVALLLHHMLHAYFMCVCDEGSGGQLEHGEHYWTAMYALIDVAKAFDEHSTLRRQLIGNLRLGDLVMILHGDLERGGGSATSVHSYSLCYAPAMRLISRDTTLTFYRSLEANLADRDASAPLYTFDATTRAATPISRAAAGPILSYIELRWDNRNFVYPLSAIDGRASSSFLDANFDIPSGRRRLDLPSWTDTRAFTALHKFLCSGAWEPSALPAAGSSQAPLVHPSSSFDGTTPDDIKVQERDLVTTLRAHRLATKIKFDRMQEYCLARLYAPSDLKCNPVPSAASEIYLLPSVQVPDARLRRWFKAMLLRCDALGMGYFSSNLWRIERTNGAVTDRDARRGGVLRAFIESYKHAPNSAGAPPGLAALEMDYKKARELLLGETPTDAPQHERRAGRSSDESRSRTASMRSKSPSPRTRTRSDIKTQTADNHVHRQDHDHHNTYHIHQAPEKRLQQQETRHPERHRPQPTQPSPGLSSNNPAPASPSAPSSSRTASSYKTAASPSTPRDDHNPFSPRPSSRRPSPPSARARTDHTRNRSPGSKREQERPPKSSDPPGPSAANPFTMRQSANTPSSRRRSAVSGNHREASGTRKTGARSRKYCAHGKQTEPHNEPCSACCVQDPAGTRRSVASGVDDWKMESRVGRGTRSAERDGGEYW